MSFSLSPFPYIHTHQHTHINTHINLIHKGYWVCYLFLKRSHMKRPFPYAHMNTHTHTHTHVDHVLFLKSFSLHTPYTLTSTHTHQPDTPGLFGLCSCPETRTHEMSSSLHTHEHTHTQTMSFSFSPFPYTLLTHTHQHTPINTYINLIHQGYSGYLLVLKHTHEMPFFLRTHEHTRT
jgi:hypothetical protein